MDTQIIINKVNTYLHEASKALLNWLNELLPKITDNWWEECVMPKLSYTQHEIALKKNYSNLSNLDFSALLRIASESWYDIQTVIPLHSYEYENIRKMVTVCSNWAHYSVELPKKDNILQDLNTISIFINQFGGSQTVCNEINDLIGSIELPNSIISGYDPNTADNAENNADSSKPTGSIQENSLVYIVSSPETKGVVMSVKRLGDTVQYNVFVNNEVKQYYNDQITLVKQTSENKWLSLSEMRSCLTAYQINNPSSHNLYSLNSARIDFVPYQFRPALKMIRSDEPRILIADSVGVGKTIEAGLIIKELEARSDLERVLVICPKPLVAERKWELEMKRFDEEFIPVDGTTLKQIISDTDRDGDWPARYNKLIIPYSILDSKVYNGESGKRNRVFGLTELDPEPHFDLVIVDEAHHIRNGSTDKEKAFDYKCTKYFCDHADAVVMLTATPLQTSNNNLFTLLNLLRPDIIIDKKTFDMMSLPNSNICQAVRLVRAAGDNWNEDASQELAELKKTQWGKNIIAKNPLYNEILQRLKCTKINREERVKLISDIESLHSFGTMLNRTRRCDIQDFCIRRSNTVSVEFTDYQKNLHNQLLRFEQATLSALHSNRTVAFMISTIRRQAASCIFGLAPYIRDIINKRLQQLDYDSIDEVSEIDIDEKTIDVFSSIAKNLLDLADSLPDEDPKFDQTYKIICEKQKEPNNKIMIFSTFRNTLSYLKRKISECGIRVEQIDGSVNDEVRYKLKERFELPRENENAIDILLFSEVGSEGLDYQFCNMMINYDLPWNPMRIEQRIGRIDRRGQLSNAVNIYNIITEGTVDAEIYYRCLWRIGVFESSIGDCEEILGKIASDIDSLVYNTDLTDEERNKKLDQIADNEIYKKKELERLEDAEKELFGFDLTEFSTSQEIKRAENPWISAYFLQKLIENYIVSRVGKGRYIIGESPLKTIRLPASARAILREDLQKIPGKRNALRRTWENYLSGKNPNHSITFDSETASKERDSFFITAMHPLAKQAAQYFNQSKMVYVHLKRVNSDIPSGQYVFSVYAWQFTGYNTYTQLITVCENEKIAKELPYLLEEATESEREPVGQFDWSDLENRHVKMWQEAREKHKTDIKSTEAFKLESIANTFNNRIHFLEQQLINAHNDSIKRMRQSELDTVRKKHSQKISDIKCIADRADVLTTLLVNGVITITEE
ncbi:MAG: DEAD/DEAH box helicase [Ruminococcaceae bacterium]|nr:DEAD/DEAH box helicase [Oscillospiraceae bacterium]